MMNRALWYMFKRGGGDMSTFMRKTYLPAVHHMINERAVYRAILDKYVEDGKIGVIRSGMDCDCTQYYDESIIDAPRGAVKFVLDEVHHEEWLDGPESTRWAKPSDIEPQHKSADRALEAYEDGHPSVVYYGSL